MNYIDGFALPIVKENLDEYKAAAKQVAEIYKEYGALAYYEYLGDDLHLEGTRAFPECLGATENDVVVFGWIVYNSKEERDLANEKVASDPRMPGLIDPLMNPFRMVFDPSKMAFGGFRSFIQ